MARERIAATTGGSNGPRDDVFAIVYSVDIDAPEARSLRDRLRVREAQVQRSPTREFA